jgi:hypothetical protein
VLGVTRGLEPAHRSLPLARRLMGVFCSIVEPFMLAVLHVGHDLLVRSLVAGKLVRDQHARDVGAAFEQLAEELPRCGL